MKSDVTDQDAASRMAASRSEIARWLASHGIAPASPSPNVNLTSTASPGLQAQLVSLALASMAENLFGQTQAKTPSLSPVQLVSLAVDQILCPLAKRHPWALVGAATLTGGALVAAKPWRLLSRPEVIGAIATQVVTRMLATATVNATSGVSGQTQPGPPV
jgi:hypothetical protein